MNSPYQNLICKTVQNSTVFLHISPAQLKTGPITCNVATSEVRIRPPRPVGYICGVHNPYPYPDTSGSDPSGTMTVVPPGKVKLAALDRLKCSAMYLYE